MTGVDYASSLYIMNNLKPKVFRTELKIASLTRVTLQHQTTAVGLKYRQSGYNAYAALESILKS